MGVVPVETTGSFLVASSPMGWWCKALRGMIWSVESRTGISVLLSGAAKRNNNHNTKKK